jgi:hypothetical protein
MAKKRVRSTVVLKAKQLALPAGFHETTGKHATMAQVVSPRTPTVDGVDLTMAQKVSLTVARISRQKRFRLVTRQGAIGKARAIEEVRALTPLGLAIIDLEETAMQFVREEVERRRARRRRARR